MKKQNLFAPMLRMSIIWTPLLPATGMSDEFTGENMTEAK